MENINMCCRDCKYSWLSPLDHTECVCCDTTKEKHGFKYIINRHEKKDCCENNKIILDTN